MREGGFDLPRRRGGAVAPHHVQVLRAGYYGFLRSATAGENVSETQVAVQPRHGSRAAAMTVDLEKQSPRPGAAQRQGQIQGDAALADTSLSTRDSNNMFYFG